MQFVDETDSRIKDVLDMKRNGTLELVNPDPDETSGDARLGLNQSFAGHGVMIVAKETANDKVPLCLGLGPSANQVRSSYYCTITLYCVLDCRSYAPPMLLMHVAGSADAVFS